MIYTECNFAQPNTDCIYSLYAERNSIQPDTTFLYHLVAYRPVEHTQYSACRFTGQIQVCIWVRNRKYMLVDILLSPLKRFIFASLGYDTSMQPKQLIPQ